MGLSAAVAGSVRVLGENPSKSMRSGRLGALSKPLEWPKDWSTLDYLVWSTRLAGYPRAEAKSRAVEALRVAGLSSEGSRGLRQRPALTQWLACLAALRARGAEVVVSQDPSPHLNDLELRRFSEAFVELLGDAHLIAFVDRIDLSNPWLLLCQDIAVLEGNQVLARGSASELGRLGRAFVLRVQGNRGAFCRLAKESGMAVTPSTGESLKITLGHGQTSTELFKLAVQCEAFIVQLHPWPGSWQGSLPQTRVE
jgi:ABC-type multidrug transport system ATPase subunit